MMYPDEVMARKLLAEANALNPGPWEAHSRAVAHCAREIARRAGMDADKAYACGLLHDIGRRFGRFHFGHIIYGYRYMLELGYDEAARMSEVKQRYGWYPQAKWDTNLKLKAYFEEKTGQNLYEFLTDDTALWGR